jgi:outer membrane protein assembly factor BamB
MKRLTPIALGLFTIAPLFGAEPWSTYRGNAQRTGNTDDQPGPATPKVAWVLKSQEHFLAAPVPAGDRLLVAGLGAFNVATVQALAVNPKAQPRVVFSRSTPLLKLPTVSSPALSSGKLVFGDGMHQTDGAVLHCLTTERGLPLWQLPVPGKLVHLEGSPTVDSGRVYVGGGNAGVLAVELDRVTLDGKEYDLDAVQKLMARRWQELLAKYEDEKKKDPDFAVPPTEEQLPKPTPRIAWQQGRDRWHIDAPIALAGERVLAASAFLDREKIGDRALLCLEAKTGELRWRTPLAVNPWGGPSVAGDLVVLGGSTIGFEPSAIRGAKGTIAAFGMSDGRAKWQRDLPGGVVSCVALVKDMAVATATDGHVYAFDVATGEPRWRYDAKAPFFAPVAIGGGVVYAADLRGRVHALDLKTGTSRWTFDVAADPAVKAPGMIYGGPVLQGGRLFFATCNLDNAKGRAATAVICLDSATTP